MSKYKISLSASVYTSQCTLGEFGKLSRKHASADGRIVFALNGVGWIGGRAIIKQEIAATEERGGKSRIMALVIWCLTRKVRV